MDAEVVVAKFVAVALIGGIGIVAEGDLGHLAGTVDASACIYHTVGGVKHGIFVAGKVLEVDGLLQGFVDAEGQGTGGSLGGCVHKAVGGGTG